MLFYLAKLALVRSALDSVAGPRSEKAPEFALFAFPTPEPARHEEGPFDGDGRHLVFGNGVVLCMAPMSLSLSGARGVAGRVGQRGALCLFGSGGLFAPARLPASSCHFPGERGRP